MFDSPSLANFPVNWCPAVVGPTDLLNTSRALARTSRTVGDRAEAGSLDALEQIRELVDAADGRAAGQTPWPAGFLLSVAMPVFNERRTIAEIVSRVLAVDVPKELIIVDDASTDGTTDVLTQLADHPQVRVLVHRHNQGKGAALRTAFAAARGDVVLTQDADLEYNPAEYHRLLEPLWSGQADVVYGSRFLSGHAQSCWAGHRLGNGLLTACSNLLNGLKLSDMETGYKAIRRQHLAELRLVENRFGVEPELTAKLARRGARIVEVPISYQGRNYAAGKKIGLADGLKAFYCIARYACAD